MVSSAGIPPLVGTAARRRRALAHLSPIFDLHLYRARNPSDVDWSLPFVVTRLDYLGDLDPAGLAIAAAACATADRVGVPAGPADRLWALLIDQPSRVGRKVDEIDALQLVAWLSEELRERASALLVAGRAIPQEALRFDVLADAFA